MACGASRRKRKGRSFQGVSRGVCTKIRSGSAWAKRWTPVACPRRHRPLGNGDALAFRDGHVCDRVADCTMANHVHALLGLGDWLSSLGMGDLKPVIPHTVTEGGKNLTAVLANLKKHTALRANRILTRSGPFWQDESYDHLIRSGEEFEHAARYILGNPVQAGLCGNWREWPWTYCAPWLLELL